MLLLKFKNNKNISGITKLEVLLVMIIISILTFLSHFQYKRYIQGASFGVAKYHADIFFRSMSAYNAQKTIIENNKNFISEHSSTQIFFNEFGWPASTNPNTSPKYGSQTDLECNELWSLVFKNIVIEDVGYKNSIEKNKLYIYSINSKICRYKLVGKKDESPFFDYHLDTGQVKLSR